MQEIKEHISNDQEQEIMELLICKSRGKDRIIWPHTKDGVYTIKNENHCLKNVDVGSKICKPFGSHRVEEVVWNEIWKLLVITVSRLTWNSKKQINGVATNHFCLGVIGHRKGSSFYKN